MFSFWVKIIFVGIYLFSISFCGAATQYVNMEIHNFVENNHQYDTTELLENTKL